MRTARQAESPARKAAKEPRRQALVLAAYEQLAQRGFEGLRTREVAGAARVNIATLHYYFPHKQDLIRGVVGHAMARFRSTLVAAGSSAAQLRAHFAGVRRISRNEPQLFAVMGELALRAGRDPAIAAIVGETDQAWHRTLRTLLRRAREDRAIDEDVDPDDAAALIIAALKGTYLLPAASRHPERLHQALRELERRIGLAGGRSGRDLGRATRFDGRAGSRGARC